MPGFDGTGPRGMGPMTGGGRGFCATPIRTVWPGYAWRAHMPYSYAIPWGMPYRGAYPFSPVISRQDELDYLKGLAQSMGDDLKEIEARIQEIENEKEQG
jgi:hypothetical protein